MALEGEVDAEVSDMGCLIVVGVVVGECCCCRFVGGPEIGLADADRDVGVVGPLFEGLGALVDVVDEGLSVSVAGVECGVVDVEAVS